MAPRALANYIDSLPRIGIFEREGCQSVFMVERGPGTWAMTVLGSAYNFMADSISSDHLPNRAEPDDVPSWSRLRRTPGREGRLWLGVYTETARGWPMLALRETHILDPMDRPPERVIGGIPIQRTAPTGMDPRSLPLIPIWRGMIYRLPDLRQRLVRDPVRRSRSAPLAQAQDSAHRRTVPGVRL